MRLSDYYMTKAVDIFFFQLRKKMSSTLTQKVISSWKQDFQDVLDLLWILFGPKIKLGEIGLFALSTTPSFLKILEVTNMKNKPNINSFKYNFTPPLCMAVPCSCPRHLVHVLWIGLVLTLIFLHLFFMSFFIFLSHLFWYPVKNVLTQANVGKGFLPNLKYCFYKIQNVGFNKS